MSSHYRAPRMEILEMLEVDSTVRLAKEFQMVESALSSHDAAKRRDIEMETGLAQEAKFEEEMAKLEDVKQRIRDASSKIDPNVLQKTKETLILKDQLEKRKNEIQCRLKASGMTLDQFHEKVQKLNELRQQNKEKQLMLRCVTRLLPAIRNTIPLTQTGIPHVRNISVAKPVLTNFEYPTTPQPDAISPGHGFSSLPAHDEGLFENVTTYNSPSLWSRLNNHPKFRKEIVQLEEKLRVAWGLSEVKFDATVKPKLVHNLPEFIDYMKSQNVSDFLRIETIRKILTNKLEELTKKKFTEDILNTKLSCIYRIIDRTGVCLYIGQTTNYDDRKIAHLSDEEKWEVYPPPITMQPICSAHMTSFTRSHFEAIGIAVETPRCNVKLPKEVSQKSRKCESPRPSKIEYYKPPTDHNK